MQVKPFVKYRIETLRKAKRFVEMLPPIIALHAEIYRTSSDDVIRDIIKEQYIALLLASNLPDRVKNMALKIFDMSVVQLYEYISDLQFPNLQKVKLLTDMSVMYGIVKD